MKILNLTQHPATAEQQAAGVFDMSPEQISALKEVLIFNKLPTLEQINDRAQMIAAFASGYSADHAMIGGAPYLMAPLEAALKDVGITPLYAFSIRESVEQVQNDSSVRKLSLFRHIGFVGL